MRINSAGPEVSLKNFNKISGSFGKFPEVSIFDQFCKFAVIVQPTGQTNSFEFLTRSFLSFKAKSPALSLAEKRS